ncbi:hypothetical protein MJ581_09965 [Escherichia coli]|nr:hypothetical protein MJ581_09965 [Escherichia coli]
MKFEKINPTDFRRAKTRELLHRRQFPKAQALSAALAIGNIELVKPNQKELSALVNRELGSSQTMSAKPRRKSLIAARPNELSFPLGPQGALGRVDSENCIQVVPPPV